VQVQLLGGDPDKLAQAALVAGPGGRSRLTGEAAEPERQDLAERLLTPSEASENASPSPAPDLPFAHIIYAGATEGLRRRHDRKLGPTERPIRAARTSSGGSSSGLRDMEAHGLACPGRSEDHREVR